MLRGVVGLKRIKGCLIQGPRKCHLLYCVMEFAYVSVASFQTPSASRYWKHNVLETRCQEKEHGRFPLTDGPCKETSLDVLDSTEAMERKFTLLNTMLAFYFSENRYPITVSPLV